MRDIVIIPTYWRPDYIDRCFRALSECDGIKSKELWVSHDQHSNTPSNRKAQIPELLNIVNQWLPRFENSRFIKREDTKHPMDSFSGYRFNVFEALIEAQKTEARLIYYIEDDVVVTSDFFRWHEAVQIDGDYLCSFAWRYPQEISASLDLEGYMIARPTTTTIGLCLKNESLEKVLNPCSLSRGIDQGIEFGMLNLDWQCVMPKVPRCYHIGQKSTHPLPENGFGECGTVDDLPNPLPKYKWDKVILDSISAKG